MVSRVSGCAAQFVSLISQCGFSYGAGLLRSVCGLNFLGRERVCCAVCFLNFPVWFLIWDGSASQSVSFIFPIWFLGWGGVCFVVCFLCFPNMVSQMGQVCCEVRFFNFPPVWFLLSGGPDETSHTINPEGTQYAHSLKRPKVNSKETTKHSPGNQEASRAELSEPSQALPNPESQASLAELGEA